MLVCPRCRTSNIRNPRYLSIHVAQYCTGSTLPSNDDGQHPLSTMAITSLQQARHFNAPEVNIALPTINTLYAMPSISQFNIAIHNTMNIIRSCYCTMTSGTMKTIFVEITNPNPERFGVIDKFYVELLQYFQR